MKDLCRCLIRRSAGVLVVVGALGGGVLVWCWSCWSSVVLALVEVAVVPCGFVVVVLVSWHACPFLFSVNR